MAVERWYPSKIDWWIGLVILLGPLGVATAIIALAISGQSLPWPVFIAFGAMLLIYGGIVFPMRYGIADEAIVVRHGLVRQKIALADVIEVSPTRNPLSSPALSLDRLKIKFGEGRFKWVMISPDDKQGFLDELATKAKLRRDGERLVR